MNADRRKKLNALQDLLQQTGLSAAMDNLKAIRDALEGVRDEEQEAFDNLPEGLQSAERGQDMEAAIEALTEAFETLEGLIDGFDFDLIDEAFSKIEDAKGMQA